MRKARTTRPTWGHLVRAAPRLKALLEEARQVRSHDSPTFCANNVWFGYFEHRGFKPRLHHLVGWAVADRRGASHLLASSEAYEVAYQKIYQALPDCRDCVWCA